MSGGVDAARIAPEPAARLGDGEIEPWRKNGRRMNMYYGRTLRWFCDHIGIDKTVRYEKLTKTARRVLMHGTTEIDESRLGFSFEGVIPNLRRRFQKTDSDYIKERLRSYMSSTTCPVCRGQRLRPEALHVKVNSEQGRLSIAEVTAMTIEEALEFFAAPKLSDEKARIAEPILRAITARLGFLAPVGLNYLTLYRTA